MISSKQSNIEQNELSVVKDADVWHEIRKVRPFCTIRRSSLLRIHLLFPSQLSTSHENSATSATVHARTLTLNTVCNSTLPRERPFKKRLSSIMDQDRQPTDSTNRPPTFFPPSRTILNKMSRAHFANY